MAETGNSLAGRKIILGITGSIAAYKAAVLLRLLTKAGADVQVIMTEAAQEFVGPLTFSTLCNKPVLTKLSADDQWSQHVRLGLWAELMIIAPTSANTIAKLSCGLVDNLLTAVYLSARCPVMISPAMDMDMWNHHATQANIQRLTTAGNIVLPVETGALASGLSGPGRLAEPEHIFEFVVQHFSQSGKLFNKQILITAGPTYEALDPVRFIGNYSSGKMGLRLAEEALKMGAKVELILGPSKETVLSHPSLKITRVQSADDMFNAVKQCMDTIDIFILAAAVSDFRPSQRATQKIKKTGTQKIQLELSPTQDIAAYIGEKKSKSQFACGFALETDNIVEHAREKLRRKNMDLIVINSPRDENSAFDHDTNKIMLLDNSGKLISFELKSKKEVAVIILNAIIERLHS